MFGHIATFTKIHRSCEPEWAETCQILRDSSITHDWNPAETVGCEAIAELLAENEQSPKVICWSNRDRRRINEEFGKNWPVAYDTEPLPFFEGNDKFQSFQFYVGMPVISKVNDRARRFCNND